MKILYAARTARFDLLRATCKLACYITKWTPDCDRKIYRLLCYIHSSYSKRQAGWIGDNLCDVAPHLYADADFAGCVDSQRSTTGAHFSIEGPSSYYPIASVSKRQTAVSSSTPEAESVSGHYAYKNMLILALELWVVVLPKGFQAVFHEDNQAMIRVIQTGKNPTMRHLGRVHRISIRWLHERLGCQETKDNVELRYEDTARMAADIYTKAFNDKDKWEHAQTLIGVTDANGKDNCTIQKHVSDRAIIYKDSLAGVRYNKVANDTIVGASSGADTSGAISNIGSDGSV
jgi:hypothetical protein